MPPNPQPAKPVATEPAPQPLDPVKVHAALRAAALRAQQNVLTLTHHENLTQLAKDIFGKDATLAEPKVRGAIG